MTDASPVTLFCSPKAFVGHNALIQRNAIRNWRALGLPVILMGGDQGVAEAAREFGCGHIADVASTEFGTPRLDDMFRQAQLAARTPFVGYINGDILLPPSFAPAVSAAARFRRGFLMVGRRWDVEVGEALDFAAGWPERLEALRRQRGVPHAPWGIDYFAFPRGQITDMPPFAVGRPGWDNWLIDHAARGGLTLINASARVPVLHQNHDYRHVPGAIGNMTAGSPESVRNAALVAERQPGLRLRHASIYRAGWRIDRHGRMRPDITLGRMRWYARALPSLLLSGEHGLFAALFGPAAYDRLRRVWHRVWHRVSRQTSAHR